VSGVSASDDKLRLAVIEEAKELASKCYSHFKEHRISSEDWARRRDWLGLPVAIFAAIASATAFTQLPGSGAVAGSLALIVTIGTALISFLAPGEKVAHHRLASDQYYLLYLDINLFLKISAEGVAETNRLKEWLESEYEQFKKIHLARPEMSDRVRKKAGHLNAGTPIPRPWWQRGPDKGRASDNHPDLPASCP
jgi:hypothetical protein